MTSACPPLADFSFDYQALYFIPANPATAVKN